MGYKLARAQARFGEIGRMPFLLTTTAKTCRDCCELKGVAAAAASSEEASSLLSVGMQSSHQLRLSKRGGG